MTFPYDNIENNENFKNVSYYTVHNGQYLKINRAKAIRVRDVSKKNEDYKHNDYKGNNYSARERYIKFLEDNGKEMHGQLEGCYYISKYVDSGLLEFIYNTNTNEISFVIWIGDEINITIDKGGNARAIVKRLGSGIKLSGEFSSTNGKFYATGDMQGYNEDDFVELIEKACQVLDKGMYGAGINVKMSDFGLSY